jgi:hypothetical protein
MLRLKIESDNGAFPTLKNEINCYIINLCFLRNLISLTVKKVRDFPIPSWDVTNQTFPEYVILEDFNLTRSRHYPRVESTPARFVPGVFVKTLKCHLGRF